MDTAHWISEEYLEAIENSILALFEAEHGKLYEKYMRMIASAIKKGQKMLSKMKTDAEVTDYTKWLKNTVLTSPNAIMMRYELERDFLAVSKAAYDMINSYMAEIYRESFDYCAYEIEKRTRRILFDTKSELDALFNNTDVPQARLDDAKLTRWNRQQIQASIATDINKGKTVEEVMTDAVEKIQTNKNAAIRTSRTLVTEAENRGRLNAYKEAEKLGVIIRKVWRATYDDRTRHTHAMIDGERRQLGEKFSNGCRYPGDHDGEPSEVFNCRCVLLADIDGRTERGSVRDGKDYTKWSEDHADEYFKETYRRIVNRAKEKGGYTEKDARTASNALKKAYETYKAKNKPRYAVAKSKYEYAEARLKSLRRAYEETHSKKDWRAFTRFETSKKYENIISGYEKAKDAYEWTAVEKLSWLNTQRENILKYDGGDFFAYLSQYIDIFA